MTMQKPVRCADCMNRRQFLTTAASAASLVVVACGDGNVSGVPGKTIVLPTGPTTIKVGDHAALATVGSFALLFDGAVAVKRTGTTTFDALQMVCTHEGCRVLVTTNTQLDCPCHQSRFDGNGAVLRGPADRALSRYPTSYNAATDILTIG